MVFHLLRADPMVMETTQVLAIILVAIAMAPAIAHAFEFPGKKRLSKQAYVAVQSIYYPGFTLLGFTEPAALTAVVMLLLLTPRGSEPFWLLLGAAGALFAMQSVYWVVIHPINKYWLEAAKRTPGRLAGTFFSHDPLNRGAIPVHSGEVEWTTLRDHWEYSHIARAALAFLSFLLVLLANA
jgi:hypothetical protein